MEKVIEIEFENDFKTKEIIINDRKIIIKIIISDPERPTINTDIKNLGLNAHPINIIPGEIK